MDVSVITFVLRLLAAIGILMVSFALLSLLWNHPPLLGGPGPAARLGTYLTTNTARMHEGATLPELQPRRYAVAPAQLQRHVEQAIAELGWELRKRGGPGEQMHAVVTTPLWRFRDDVRVEIRPDGESASVLFVESGSRAGKADFGANIRHVLDLTDAIERRMTDAVAG